PTHLRTGPGPPQPPTRRRPRTAESVPRASTGGLGRLKRTPKLRTGTRTPGTGPLPTGPGPVRLPTSRGIRTAESVPRASTGGLGGLERARLRGRAGAAHPGGFWGGLEPVGPGVRVTRLGAHGSAGRPGSTDTADSPRSGGLGSARRGTRDTGPRSKRP